MSQKGCVRGWHCFRGLHCAEHVTKGGYHYSSWLIAATASLCTHTYPLASAFKRMLTRTNTHLGKQGHTHARKMRLPCPCTCTCTYADTHADVQLNTRHVRMCNAPPSEHVLVQEDLGMHVNVHILTDKQRLHVYLLWQKRGFAHTHTRMRVHAHL